MTSTSQQPILPVNARTWLWHHPGDGLLPILFTLATAAPFIICFQNAGIAELFGRLMTPSLAAGILVFVLTALHFLCVRLCVFHHVQAERHAGPMPGAVSRYATPMTQTLQAPSHDVFKSSDAIKALILLGSLSTALGVSLFGHQLLWLLTTTAIVITASTWSAIVTHTADLPSHSHQHTLPAPSKDYRPQTPPPVRRPGVRAGGPTAGARHPSGR